MCGGNMVFSVRSNRVFELQGRDMVVCPRSNKHSNLCELYCWDVLVVDWGHGHWNVFELCSRLVEFGCWSDCQHNMHPVYCRKMVKQGLQCMHVLHTWNMVICGWGDKHSNMSELHCWNMVAYSWSHLDRSMHQLHRWHVERCCWRHNLCCLFDM